MNSKRRISKIIGLLFLGLIISPLRSWSYSPIISEAYKQPCVKVNDVVTLLKTYTCSPNEATPEYFHICTGEKLGAKTADDKTVATAYLCLHQMDVAKATATATPTATPTTDPLAAVLSDAKAVGMPVASAVDNHWKGIVIILGLAFAFLLFVAFIGRGR